MTRDHFLARLFQCSDTCVDFTATMVANPLPKNFLYLVYPNQSYDGNPRVLDEQCFTVEELGLTLERPIPIAAEQVADALCRSEKIPEWINISVRRATEEHTTFELECCGRFSASEELIYFRGSGREPFNLQVQHPPGWKSVEESGKIDLDWRDHHARSAQILPTGTSLSVKFRKWLSSFCS